MWKESDLEFLEMNKVLPDTDKEMLISLVFKQLTGLLGECIAD